jgi:hypothetical protein
MNILSKRGTAFMAIIVSTVVACHSPMPAGFWDSYQSKAIAKRFSDQGPWGGERWILWEAFHGGFSEEDARDFAEEHGWKLLERTEVPAGVVGTSSLFTKGYDRAREGFPNFISGKSVVLI